MRPSTAIVVALSTVIALAACGSSSPKSASSSGISPSTTTVPKKAPTQAQLHSALLTVDDMPPGWSVQPPDKSSSNTSDPLCNGKTTPLDLSSASAPSVTFVQGSFVPLLAQILFADPTGHIYSELKTELDACDGKQWTARDKDGTVTTYTLASESFPKMGDESHAWRLGLKSTGAVGSVDLVAIRQGTVTIFIGGVSLTSILGNGELNPATLVSSSRKAVEKVKPIA
jgi:hypothetical protein